MSDCGVFESVLQVGSDSIGVSPPGGRSLAASWAGKPAAPEDGSPGRCEAVSGWRGDRTESWREPGLVGAQSRSGSEWGREVRVHRADVAVIEAWIGTHLVQTWVCCGNTYCATLENFQDPRSSNSGNQHDSLQFLIQRGDSYSWLSRKAPSPLRSPGLPPSLTTP